MPKSFLVKTNRIPKNRNLYDPFPDDLWFASQGMVPASVWNSAEYPFLNYLPDTRDYNMMDYSNPVRIANTLNAPWMLDPKMLFPKIPPNPFVQSSVAPTTFPPPPPVPTPPCSPPDSVDSEKAERDGVSKGATKEKAKYSCQDCGKSFSRTWNYQRHLLIHKGEKRYRCDLCPMAFLLAAHLKIHYRVHTGEKPYMCQHCDRGFAQLTNLQRHSFTHTGVRPHKCSLCGKGFVSSSDLRRHERIHTGVKPYRCHVCDKHFTTSGNLRSHELTHSGEKPHKCTLCDLRFISPSNLRAHIRTRHVDTRESGGGDVDGNSNKDKIEGFLHQDTY